MTDPGRTGDDPGHTGDDPGRTGEGSGRTGEDADRTRDDTDRLGDDARRSIGDSARAVDDPERAAASFAAGLSLAEVPGPVLDRARTVLADALGAAVGGIDVEPVASLAGEWARYDGPASVPAGGTTSPLRAAVVNGAAATVLEADPGHARAGGHPASYLLPALLAECEAADRSGEALLAGFVAGYEVCARAGIACDPREGYHPHGLPGAVGAAVAVERARGADADRTLAAARNAASGAQHGRFEAALEGVPTAYAGVGNLRGLIAADEAAAGFRGLDGGIARHLELACDGGFDATALADGLGEHWELQRGYFKPHAACRFTHPAVDAVADLQSRGAVDPATVDPGEIAGVTVETYPLAAELDAARPDSPHEARFSVPFAVATRILRGAADEPAFGPEALTEETYALADRVSVTATDEMTDRLPDARSARVTVRLRDGTECVAEVRHARGTPENPLSPEELRGKFDGLVGPVLGDDRAADLWNAVHDLPDADPRRIGAILGG